MSTLGWIIGACILLVPLLAFVVVWWLQDAETQREIDFLTELAVRQDGIFLEQAKERLQAGQAASARTPCDGCRREA